MVTITSLWLPILLSAVAAFVASSVIWMAMPWHKKDFLGLPDEEAARKALGPQNLAPGRYNIPHVADRAMLKDPAFIKKAEEGPVAVLTVAPRGMPGMGKNMGQWLVFQLVVSVTGAYIATRTLAPGTPYLQVFRVVGTVTWLAYGWASISDSIWFFRPWGHTVKNLVDALIYALLTAGFFGAFWPR